MLEVLLMDDEINQQINDLLLYAELNSFNMEQMVDAQKSKTSTIPKDTYDNHVILLPYDIRVVYTVEEHPIGMCKHISISQNGELPKKEDYILILDKFSFNVSQSKDVYTYSEKCLVDGIECKTLNVIEPFSYNLLY